MYAKLQSRNDGECEGDLMLWKTFGVLSVVAAMAIPAQAYTTNSFYGWSADGSYYAHGELGQDLVERAEVCRLGSTTGQWPKDIAPPAADSSCTSLCDESGLQCADAKKAKKTVRLPAPSAKGPAGETVQVKVEGVKVQVSVSAGGAKLGETTVELEKPGEIGGVREVFWRPGGGAVAVQLGWPNVSGGDGTQPPKYLAILQWTSGRAATGNRSTAEAANARGMKLYRSKDYANAKTAFQGSIAADASYVLPHYNLACVLALLGDKAGAIAELKWLSASSDPLAKTKLDKAKSDSDLATVTHDPSVAKLLGQSGASSTCNVQRERCENDCSADKDDAYVRGCVRACTSKYDECTGGGR